MPPCTARTGEPAAAPISMPLRWIEVPKVPVVERPKRVSTGPASGHGRSPWNGRSGRSTAGAPSSPASVDCSRCRACSSSPTNCAASSRRRSSSSSIRVRSATAWAAAASRFDGLGAQPRDLPLLRLQLGARRLLFGQQAAMFGDADLLDPRQRHHAAAGPRQVALVGRCRAAAARSRGGRACRAPAAVLRAPACGRRAGLRGPARGPCEAATLALTAARRALTAASSSARSALVSSSCRSAASVVLRLLGQRVGLALQGSDAIAGALHQDGRCRARAGAAARRRLPGRRRDGEQQAEQRRAPRRAEYPSRCFVDTQTLG